MIALQETSSEDLGFKLSTKPEGIRIFNDTIDFLEGDKNDLNLLSIGNLTGYFACSNMSSIVLDKLSLLETGDVAEGHEIRRIENLTNVSQLTFNCDESELYVVIDGNLKVINMGQYVTSEVGSEIIKEIENIEEKYIQGVKVIHPSPGSPDSVALINNLDELILIDSGVAKALQSGVSSFCWAKNGETIYYGTSSSADVTAVSANGEVLFKILNSAVSDPSEVSLVSIVELESNSKWFAVYDRGEGEPEDHEYQIYIIEKADDHTYEFYESDIAPPFGSVTRFGTYYLLSLSNWSSGQALVFVTSSLATEVSTLFINAEGRIESVTQLNDSDRAQFPINDDTGDDASPIGLGLDLTCLESVITEPCSGIDEAKGTLPKLWCLTHEGTLISWWIFDVHGLKNGKVNLQRALDYLKQEKVGSTKPSDKKEENSINTKLLNSNASATSSSENPGQSINQPLSNTPNDKTGFGASAFGTSKIGSSSSGAAFGSTGFGSTGFGSSSSGSGTGTSTGFGSTGFGSFSKPSESFGSTGFGGSKKSSESGFGSSGFGSSGFDTTGFGSNTSESMDDNKFGNTGFGSSTASSNNFKSAGGFGKYSNNNTSSQNQSSPFSSLGNKESPFAGASRDESPFAKFGKEAQPATENKTESPFAKFGKDTSSENKTESPFAKFEEASSENKTESPFAKFGKEAQPTTENKTESPFAKFGKDTSSENKTESPFAKFGKEAQPTTENKTESRFAKFEEASSENKTESPFAKFEEASSENKTESPFAKFGKDTSSENKTESPFAKFGKDTSSENKTESPFAKFGKEAQPTTENKTESRFAKFEEASSENKTESPFAKFGKDTSSENKTESPFAKFGKEAQPTTENKTESPFAKFSKDTSSENNTESPFAKFGKEAQPTTENKTETPFAKFGKKSDTTFNIIQSSDSSNQSVTSNEETSSETPVEGEAKPESLDLLSPLKNEINENKDKVASHVGNNEEKQGSLFKSLQRNAMGADKQSDSETSSPESSESESSDESDDIAASKPKENVSNLLESMDIKSNNEPSKSGNLHESTTRIDRTENSGISPSSGAKKQDEVDSNQQALTPPSPLEFLTFEGIQGPVKGESNIVSKKIVDVYNETCGYLIIMENNVQRLAKFIDDHNTTVDRPDHKRSLDTPDLWRLASSTDLNSIIGQVKPALSSILKSSHDLDSSLTNLTAKVEESQVQRVKIDKLLSQLSLFNKESNSLVLTKRPLDFHNESLQTSLRQKLRRVKDLENELISKMMPFKARSRTDENILKNLEKVIFQMNESAYDHLKEINSLSVELCDLKLHNESDSEMPKNNHKQQSNQASVKWILSKELKNNSNSSPRLVSLHRK